MTKRPNFAGFSLLELLITLAIVAILASITIPSYNGLVAKSRRSDAMSTLVLIQLAQERWRSQHRSYAPALDKLGWFPESLDGYYQLRITRADENNFLLLAEPAGSQQSDVCGALAIDANGPVYARGYAGPRCWNR